MRDQPFDSLSGAGVLVMYRKFIARIASKVISMEGERIL